MALYAAVMAIARTARRLGAVRSLSVLTTGLVGASAMAISMVSDTDTAFVEEARFTSGPGTSIRSYIRLDAGADAHARADLAVMDLDRLGGFARSAVVIAVPTGSGWIDANAIAGLEDRFDGDTAIVGMQYARTPSWIAFLTDRDSAQESAAALLGAVNDRLALMPPDQRPDIYIYGQSLGALGGSAATHTARESICGALWAGRPGLAMDPAFDMPASKARLHNTTTLANSSDPVVYWAPQLIWRAPNLEQLHHVPAGYLVSVSCKPASTSSAHSPYPTGTDIATAPNRAQTYRRATLNQRYQLAQRRTETVAATQAGSAIGPRAASYAAPTW
ncbi:MAG: hypothetical protein GX601_06320 [Anaerolineales bacterium]|nr:hypothetical protein [Anaerolineales bacterium]